MKYTVQTLAYLVLSVFSLQALAIVVPNWHRPILGSDMQVTTTSGVLQPLQQLELTLGKKDGAEQPTAIIVNMDQELFTLPITRISRDDCGSVVYEASSEAFSNSDSEIVVVRLTDHLVRFCDDLKVNRWESTFSVSDIDGNILGLARLLGQPEPLFTIQVEQKHKKGNFFL